MPLAPLQAHAIACIRRTQPAPAPVAHTCGGGAAAASRVLSGDVSGLVPESIGASHNDYGAIQLYLAAFVDVFWKDFWAGY